MKQGEYVFNRYNVLDNVFKTVLSNGNYFEHYFSSISPPRKNSDVSKCVATMLIDYIKTNY